MITRLSIVTLTIVTVSVLAAGVWASGSEPEEPSQDKTQEALEHYNKGIKHIKRAEAIERQGDSTFAFNYRATSDAKAKKEYEQAVEQFAKAVDLDPTMKEAHNYIGFSYRKMGKLTESRNAYVKALEIDPDYAQAREYLGETYLAMGDLERAKQQLDHLKKMESPYGDTLNMAIEMYRLKVIDKKMKSN